MNSQISLGFSSFFNRKKLFIFLTLLLAAYFSLPAVSAQKRDNLTKEEDVLVREAQEIDVRMKIFVKIIDRRFLALNDANAAESKQAQKDFNTWGALRTGTREEMLFDIQKTLDEIIRKIDDIAERDQKNPLFPIAVHILADGCRGFIPQLKTLQGKTAEPKEQMMISNSVDACNQIIEASAKVPKEAAKEKKKKN
jgi:hypothetical protein